MKGIWLWKENLNEDDYPVIDSLFDTFYVDFRSSFDFLERFVRNVTGDVFGVVSCEHYDLLSCRARNEVWKKAQKTLLVTGVKGVVLDYIRLNHWTLHKSPDVSELVECVGSLCQDVGKELKLCVIVPPLFGQDLKLFRKWGTLLPMIYDNKCDWKFKFWCWFFKNSEPILKAWDCPFNDLSERESYVADRGMNYSLFRFGEWKKI